MYIKMIDTKKTFGGLSVGDVFVFDDTLYIKIDGEDECVPCEGGGQWCVRYNALNLNSYQTEYIDPCYDVEPQKSTLIVGAEKGEV